MSDDVFERLRHVDPASEERVARESRALGDVPGRIAASEPTIVRRFPKAARRKVTLVAVAAVVVAAIAIPLALLRPLGDDETPGGTSPTPGGDLGDWVTVGSVAEIRDRGVTYVPTLDAFIFAPAGGDPYALLAHTDPSSGTGVRAHVLYCEPARRFIDTARNVFDDHGTLLAGTGGYDMGRYQRTRIVDGSVQIDTTQTFQDQRAVPSGGGSHGALGCPTVDGRYLQGAPGFAIPDEASIPPIAVALPVAGMTVQSPVSISGSADVFEATVSIRILDETGTPIAEAFTTATCGTGCRGEYSADVDFAVDHEQPGTVQVFESSAKDGSMINTVEIPVTLVPDTPSATDGLEGTWFDAGDQPLPNGSPDDDGNVLNVYRGAEHCQWESVTFMNIGWPVGTLSNAQGEWRQYVRDPRSVFDDGALHVGYLGDTTLPPDATDTGYHRSGWQLWVSPSEAADAVFVINTNTGSVERWARATPPILCN